MNTKLRLATIALATLLSACSQELKVNDICELYPDFCEKFTPDSWCKAERKNMLFTYHHLEQNKAEQNKADLERYNLLIALEKYKQCMNHAAKIEHIKLKEKQTARLKNEVMAHETIQEISQQTRNSKNAYLLYYHWSRYLDERALKQFIAKEKSNELNSSELQFFLATYYTKIDAHKTLGLLYRALELYKPEDKLNIEIFKSLSTLFTDKKEFKQSYIWSKVLKLYHPEDTDITDKSLQNFASLYQLDTKFLDKVAQNTLDKILDGAFKSPKY